MGEVKVYTFKEDEDIIKCLDAIAKAKGTERSALVREAIRDFIKREEREAMK